MKRKSFNRLEMDTEIISVIHHKMMQQLVMPLIRCPCCPREPPHPTITKKAWKQSTDHALIQQPQKDFYDPQLQVCSVCYMILAAIRLAEKSL